MIPTISPQGQTVQFSENIAKAQELHWRLSKALVTMLKVMIVVIYTFTKQVKGCCFGETNPFGVQATAESEHYFFMIVE